MSMSPDFRSVFDRLTLARAAVEAAAETPLWHAEACRHQDALDDVSALVPTSDGERAFLIEVLEEEMDHDDDRGDARKRRLVARLSESYRQQTDG
jgi:hypothetical protein